MRTLSRYLRPYWRLVVLALFLAAVNQIFSLLDPLIFRPVIDQCATQIDKYPRGKFFRGVGGLLALARLQRKFRLLESPYRTPQTLVGGPRLDGALMASTGHTAATKAMGKGSTQAQHLVQTEVPPRLLAGWLGLWAKHYRLPLELRVHLRPHTPGSEVLELGLFSQDGEEKANVLFAHIHDRRDRSILSVRDQNTFDHALRKKRLMTLVTLFLIHRYKAVSGPLCGSHRGQPVPGQQDEGARGLP